LEFPLFKCECIDIDCHPMECDVLRLAQKYLRFGGACCLHVQVSARCLSTVTRLKTNSVSFSETFVPCTSLQDVILQQMQMFLCIAMLTWHVAGYLNSL